MSTRNAQEPMKDGEAAHPVASVWRAAFRAVVAAFRRGDYTLARGVPSVAPVSPAAASQIAGYIAAYGETLAELPDATWESSVAQWTGTHWDVLVDLWTLESGRSDMVLAARVFEVEGSHRIQIDSVYVP